MLKLQQTRRLNRYLLTSFLIFALLTWSALAAASDFTDIQNHWSTPYVGVLLERGIISSTEDGLFRPREQITLGTFVSWIVNAKYGTQMNEDECITIARENGLLDSSLRDEELISRNTAAQITYLALERLFGEQQEDDALAQQLKDFASCHMCRLYVSQCYVKGIMTGREKQVFAGDALLTRSEGATIVLRVIAPEYRLPPEPNGDEQILLSADAARRILTADPNAILLDVRNEEERSNGYIPGSICIPLSELKDCGGTALACSKSDNIIVYCQSGGRSAQAVQLLEALGFTNVYNLGGIGNWPDELSYPH